MGSAVSSPTCTANLAKTETEIVRLMMPVYYTEENITEREIHECTQVWKMILNNTAPEFLRLSKEDENFPHPSAIAHFYTSFYDRLFDIHPMARALFRDMKSQGKFLVKMISLALTVHSDAERFRSTLEHLAIAHNERGVKAVEYGVVGEVLFWSIRCVVGAEAYNYQIHSIWVKIYSRMLQIMVPLAVAHEINCNAGQQHRFTTYSNGFNDTVMKYSSTSTDCEE